LTFNFAAQYATPNRTNQLGTRNFPGAAAHQNKFYRECQPIKLERYPCTRSPYENLCVPQVKIDFYHRGN